MAVQLICKLQIITLLDSICFGLTYPFLSTYIQSLGANHVVVGVLSVGYLLCSLISNDLVHLIKIDEKQHGMAIALFITMLAHSSLLIRDNYWVVIFGRYVYSIVANQARDMCKDLIAQNAKSNGNDHLAIFSILSGAGYIIGPIVAGYLYSNGCECIGLLAISLTFINICLAATISASRDAPKVEPDERGLLEKISRDIADTVYDFRNSRFEKNWDIMAIKFLHVSCVMIFFGKFSQILKYNFHASPVTVGNTYAYMNSLTFVCAFFTAIAKERYVPFSPILLAENSFKYLGLCLLVACYSPIYLIYMVMCVPIQFFSSLIDSTWRDLFATRGEDSLERLDVPIKVLAGLTTPLVFGVLCDNIGHHGVIIFSVIPTIISMYIINRYTKRYNFFEETDKKSE